uniref:Interferon gamma n=1 Tax=Rattus norvegicus TaxID=10116 RepID=A0ABK0KXF9_RAT
MYPFFDKSQCGNGEGPTLMMSGVPGVEPTVGSWIQHLLILSGRNLPEGLEENSSSMDAMEGKSLLLDIWRNWQKDGNTKILESQIISFYLRLFEVLKDNQAISNNISVIESHLITNFFSNSKAKKDAFMSIAKFEVNNPQIQHKAVNELIRVIHQLSPESSLRKRKRSRC